MLPPHVRLLCLSATVPNVDEFAAWVGRVRRAPVWVTGTVKRPVPLGHGVWFGGESYAFGAETRWDADGYAAAKLAWRRLTAAPDTKIEAKAARPTGRGGPPAGPNARGGGARGRGGGLGARGGAAAAAVSRAIAHSAARPHRGPRSDAAHWRSLIAWLKARDLLPAVAFFFSKRKVDALAASLAGLDLNTAAEAAEARLFCARSLARLPPGDRALPQVGRVTALLARGVGVHHAGLLPIVKEVVEMLFCRGLVKFLACTETFAMGVNAPARAVAFAALRKHDGAGFRDLLPGEYTQVRGGERGWGERGGRAGAAADPLSFFLRWPAAPAAAAWTPSAPCSSPAGPTARRPRPRCGACSPGAARGLRAGSASRIP